MINAKKVTKDLGFTYHTESNMHSYTRYGTVTRVEDSGDSAVTVWGTDASGEVLYVTTFEGVGDLLAIRRYVAAMIGKELS